MSQPSFICSSRLSHSLVTSFAKPSRLLSLLPLVAVLSLSPLIPFSPCTSVAWAANSGGTVQTIVSTPSYVGSYQGVSGPVAGGNVRIDSDFVGKVYGGYTESGDATGNSVTMSGGTVDEDVYGGDAKSGNATGNTVTLSGGTVNFSVYGGGTESGNATGNTLIISGGTVNIFATGGGTLSGNATGNIVIMRDGTVNSNVTGGSTGSGNATGNTVTISGGTVGTVGTASLGHVYGGYTTSGNATGNSVTMSGGMVYRNVYGGYTQSGNATGNTVTMSGGTVGTVGRYVYGGYTYSGDASGNTVIISGGTVSGGAYGGNTVSGNATGNTVIISGGTVQGTVVGGGGNNATGNTVTMSGGTVQGVIGGNTSPGGNATGNTVTISGGTVNGSVTGGFDGNATGNTVTISGGTVNGNVYGGYASAGGTATGNTVTLLGSPTFGATTQLWGGQVGGAAMSQGNTLNVFTSGLKAASAQGFQYANFALFSGGGTGLTLSGNATFEAGAVVTAPVALPGSSLIVGDTVSLFKAAKINGADLVSTPRGQTRQGLALIYDYSTQVSDTEITATVTGRSLNPQSEAPMQGRAASMGAVTAGADLAAGKGLESARAATAGSSAAGQSGGSAGGNSLGLIPFAAVQGGSWYTPAGNGTNASGMNILAGLAKRWNGDSADFLLGAFFEAGWGTANGESKGIYADNKINSVGGGILARVDMTGTAARGLYAELSARIGDARQQWDSNYSDVTPWGVLTAKYDKNSAYYGIHAGLGYVWDLSETLQLDMYAKYFWAQQTGFDARLAGDKFTFDTVNSHRVRAGGRLNFAVSESVKPYVGLAWEHEFDGKAGGSVYGLTLDSPTAMGSTGIAELGLRITPSQNSGFFADVNVQGTLGTRQGVLGSLMLGYEF